MLIFNELLKKFKKKILDKRKSMMYLCIVITTEKVRGRNRGRHTRDRHGVSLNLKVKPLN